MIEDIGKCKKIINQLRDSLKKSIEEREDLKSKMLYLQADFENFVNRSKRNTEEQIERKEMEIMSEIVEVLDELELTYEKSKNKVGASEFMEGLDMVISKFQKKLESMGVTAINPLGEKFNPNQHTAISAVQVDDPNLNGVVMEVLRKGYMVKRKLIRAAVVKVGVVKGD